MQPDADSINVSKGRQPILNESVRFFSSRYPLPVELLIKYQHSFTSVWFSFVDEISVFTGARVYANASVELNFANDRRHGGLVNTQSVCLESFVRQFELKHSELDPGNAKQKQFTVKG